MAKKNHIPNSGQSTLGKLFLLWSYKLHFKYTKLKKGIYLHCTDPTYTILYSCFYVAKKHNKTIPNHFYWGRLYMMLLKDINLFHRLNTLKMHMISKIQKRKDILRILYFKRTRSLFFFSQQYTKVIRCSRLFLVILNWVFQSG